MDFLSYKSSRFLLFKCLLSFQRSSGAVVSKIITTRDNNLAIFLISSGIRYKAYESGLMKYKVEETECVLHLYQKNLMKPLFPCQFIFLYSISCSDFSISECTIKYKG